LEPGASYRRTFVAAPHSIRGGKPLVRRYGAKTRAYYACAKRAGYGPPAGLLVGLSPFTRAD